MDIKNLSRRGSGSASVGRGAAMKWHRSAALVASSLWFASLGAWACLAPRTLPRLPAQARAVVPDSLPNTQESRSTPWESWVATAYSHGCACESLQTVGGRRVCVHSRAARPGATGAWPVPNLTVAADWGVYPPGTMIEISAPGGIVTRRIVGDKGRDIVGPRRIDLFFADCERADAWGIRTVDARVVSP